MPLYEYECTACHRRTEKIQKFSDPELTACPYCAGKLERTLTAPAVHFAGGGWYKDLYSSARPAGSGATDAKPGSSDTPASGSSSAESSAPAAPAAASPAPAPAAAATPKAAS